MSLAAPSPFLSGANSSSRNTSHAAKLLSHLTETPTDNPRTQGGEAGREVGVADTKVDGWKERHRKKFRNRKSA